MFFKDLLPAVAATSRDSQGIADVFNTPASVPMSNSMLFEVVADRLNDHCNHMIDMYILSGFLH